MVRKWWCQIGLKIEVCEFYAGSLTQYHFLVKDGGRTVPLIRATFI